MSISGLFLIVFLLVHLVANLTMFLGADVFNEVVHFMETNPMIQIMQPVLGLGILIHVFYSIKLTIENRKARGNDRYAVVDQSKSSKWASRNMFALGIALFAFLVIHMINYFIPMKMGTVEGTSFELVANLFDYSKTGIFAVVYTAVYLIGFLALGSHLNHGFWSAFQSIGFSNNIWRKRLEAAGKIYTFAVVAGFISIPVYFLVTSF